jgi:hypothetical protein
VEGLEGRLTGLFLALQCPAGTATEQDVLEACAAILSWNALSAASRGSFLALLCIAKTAAKQDVSIGQTLSAYATTY